jgi:hypothetical protein
MGPDEVAALQMRDIDLGFPLREGSSSPVPGAVTTALGVARWSRSGRVVEVPSAVELRCRLRAATSNPTASPTLCAKPNHGITLSGPRAVDREPSVLVPSVSLLGQGMHGRRAQHAGV